MKKILFLILVIFTLYNCTKDRLQYEPQDKQLSNLIAAHSPDGTTSFYVLPKNIEQIPQDETPQDAAPSNDAGMWYQPLLPLGSRNSAIR